MTYGYDAGTNGVGQRTSLSDGSGSTAWTYDNRGRMTTEGKTVTGAGTFTTSTSYDAADRVRTLTYPTGEVITQAYSGRGLLNGVRSQSNNQWMASNLAYNVNGSLSRTDLGNGTSTLYGYYGIGSAAFGANSWDAGPATGLGSYARLWRIRSEAPSGQPLLDLRYAYDAAGNVTAWRDAPRSITGTLAVTLSDSFDSFNGTTWVKSSGVTIPFNDGGNNDAQLIGNGVNYSVMLTRTSNSLVSGGGMQVRFKLDNTLDSFSLGIATNNSPLQRLSVADEGTGHLAVQYYDGAGKIYPVWLTPTLQANTWYTLAIVVDDVRGHTLDVYTATNGVHYTYNNLFATGQAWHFFGSIKGGTLNLDDYSEFNGGAVVVPDDKEAFTYDALNRLTQVISTTAQGYTATYSYDAIGNMLSKDEGGGSLGYGYGAAHPHAVTSVGGYAFAYDANGNMITRTEASGTWAQAWDVDNRVATMTSSGGSSATFVYDGDGKRVKRIENGITTTVFIGGIYELDLSTTVTTTYYFAGGKPLAQRRGGTLYFLQGDQLGSVSLTTDASGNPVFQARYSAFGGTRAAWIGTPIADDEAVAYTGQMTDRADGWIYFYGARLYDPYLNRFISADTIVQSTSNPQDLNRYSYTRNNPLRYVDPTGHDSDVGGGTCDEECLLTGFDAMVNGCGENGDCIRTQYEDIALYLNNLAAQAEANNTHLSDNLESIRNTYNEQVADIHRYEARLHPERYSAQDKQIILAGMEGAPALLKYGQKNVGKTFTGPEKSPFKYAGWTLEDVSEGLRTGKISPDELPVQFIRRDGDIYAINNRSLKALRMAEMEPTVTIDITGDPFYENLLTERLLEAAAKGVDLSDIRIRGQ